MRRKKFIKYFSVFMALNILFEVIQPSVALALTNGTIQPEFTGFEPANSSEMVDLFTGDFKYNIPLMDVEGYPLNLAYHAGANMESEASWVGLGWSLNPGVLNRMTRGLPDDFKGDVIKSETHMKPHAAMGVGYQFANYFAINVTPGWMSGLGAGPNVGIDGALLLTYNNYKGYGVETQLDGHGSLSAHIGPAFAQIGGGIGMTMSSQDGATLSYQHSKGYGLLNYSKTVGEGTSINTRSGAMTKTYFGNTGINYGTGGGDAISVGKSTSHTIPVGPIAYSPSIGKNYIGYGIGVSIKGGLWGCVDLNPILPVQITAGAMQGYKGFYNKTEIDKANQELPAYGYMYLENADENSLMDFNRTRDGVISKETPNISMAHHTYDIFSATAQGMASNFRAMRSDVGVVHDNTSTSFSTTYPEGFELGIGGFLHLLLDVMKVTSNGKSGLWKTQLSSTLNYVDGDPANPYFEKVYFKEMGQITARSDEPGIGGENAISPVLTPSAGVGFQASSNLPGAGGSSLTRGLARDKRVNDIVTLTGKDAGNVGFEKIRLYTQNTFSINPDTRAVVSETAVISKTTKVTSDDIKDHLSEISITKDNGARYYYGIPVYNLEKQRVIFNASDRKENSYNPNGWPTTAYTNTALLISDAYQMVKYDPVDDLIDNLRGSDNLYQIDETPQYVTSHLLTAIVSPDYVDVTGDGPSYDDLGTYTKFNYSKDDDYKWREPFPVSSTAQYSSAIGTGTLHANFESGLISDKLDDKAFFEYGKRETYYLHSIETKNYVARFTVGSRSDMKGVLNKDGGVQSSSSAKKLEKIELYSKSELRDKTVNGGTPIPIKTVNFNYDGSYTLCPGTFNSTAGKLTLSGLYFTFGNSDKAALSPYQFSYADNDHDGNMDANYNYHPRSVDRWGSYMPNTNIATGGTTSLNNVEAPYSVQTQSLADQYAAAWNLTDIVTPTGSKISITYEADDYGYVQNEQAGQMLKINNFLPSINTSSDVTAYSPNTDIRNANYMIVDMQGLRTGIAASVSFATASAIVQNTVLKLNKELYFRCFTKLGGPENSWGLKTDFYDFVPGYSEIEEVGVFDSGVPGNTYVDCNGTTCYRYAYVKLTPDIAYGSHEVNPVCLAGWDFTRTFLPRVAYPGSEPANMGDASHKPIKQINNMIVGMGVALADFIAGIMDGPNYRFFQRKFSSKVIYDKSFVRAYVPYKNKIGGGHRVKKIVTTDEWNTVTTALGGNELGSKYGQTYDYTMLESGVKISSGVAAYEPIVGGEENSMHQPYPFEIVKKMAPNDHFYQERPLGEMFYPAPLVGYSKVTVRSIDTDYGGNKAPQIGRTEYEFFTAKDYPVIEKHTDLNKAPFQNDLIDDFTIVNPAYTIFHLVQGHTLKFNDMHGKLKSVQAFGEDNITVPVSGASFYYKHSGGPGVAHQLNTSAAGLTETGASATVLSRDIDVTVDARENINQSFTAGNQFILELSLCSPISINNNVIYSKQNFGIRMASNTKIVQQYGILDSTVTFDNKSKTITSNILRDANTGNVILSSSKNDLNQITYNFSYPAHWMYPDLGSESQRIGLITEVPLSATPSANTVWNVQTGVIKKSAVNSSKLLKQGDEVLVYDQNNTIIGDNRYWVIERSDAVATPTSLGYNYQLVNAGGVILNQTTAPTLTTNIKYYFKILRPAERNQTGLTAGHVASVKTQPVITSSVQTFTSNIVSASATEYCQYWQPYEYNSVTQYTTGNIAMACLPTAMTATSNNIFNPYTAGYLGRWQPWKDYQYNIARTYTTQPNVKNDGVYASYTPFWKYSGGAWGLNSATGFDRWTVLNENTVYSPEGNLMESKDAIGVFHSQRFGFNHTLPIINATNAQVSEIGFEGFEEYNSIYPSLNYLSPSAGFANDHVGFFAQTSTVTTPSVQNTTAHTGRYSLALANTNVLTYSCAVNKNDYITEMANEQIMHGNSLMPMAKCGDQKTSILSNLKNNKRYLASFWVKANTAATDYANTFSVALTYTSQAVGPGSPITVTATVNKSPVINGWQKFDYEFKLPAYVFGIQFDAFAFKITALAGISLDDFRIQPYNAAMSCTVYDPLHLRPWAILDDRNYATIIEYDNQGIMVRKKKETEKGIYTIQETRASTVKK